MGTKSHTKIVSIKYVLTYIFQEVNELITIGTYKQPKLSADVYEYSNPCCQLWKRQVPCHCLAPFADCTLVPTNTALHKRHWYNPRLTYHLRTASNTYLHAGDRGGNSDLPILAWPRDHRPTTSASSVNHVYPGGTGDHGKMDAQLNLTTFPQ